MEKTFAQKLLALRGKMKRTEASIAWDIPYRTLADWEAARRTPRGCAADAILDRIRTLSPAPAIRTRKRNSNQ